MNGDSNPEMSSLRFQIFVLKVALIVVSCTLTGYLFMQSRNLGRERDANQKLVDSFNLGQPAVATFVNKLGAYSMTHPEIRPVLAKYGIVPAATQPGLAAPTSNSPAPAPAPAPGAAPKK